MIGLKPEQEINYGIEAWKDGYLSCDLSTFALRGHVVPVVEDFEVSYR